METIPRRMRVDKFTEAEKAIYDAIAVVENLEADPKLTEAVILLGEAKEKVSDYVDLAGLDLNNMKERLGRGESLTMTESHTLIALLNK